MHTYYTFTMRPLLYIITVTARSNEVPVGLSNQVVLRRLRHDILITSPMSTCLPPNERPHLRHQSHKKKPSKIFRYLYSSTSRGPVCYRQ